MTGTYRLPSVDLTLLSEGIILAWGFLQLAAARDKAQASLELETTSQSRGEWTDRYGKEPRKGCDILVQALEREQVQTVFAYPGGCSIEIHQALTRSPTIRNILCRHEQVDFYSCSPSSKLTCNLGH